MDELHKKENEKNVRSKIVILIADIGMKKIEIPVCSYSGAV
jgi:hypothetical protein